MACNGMSFRLHHKGYFTKDKYVGGEEVIYDVHDLDLFSYSVLMEWVLEIGYKEIGGVYMRAEEKNKWALLCNDADINEVILTTDSSSLDLYIDCDVDSSVKPVKQMQPHVIVRPKTCPVKAMQRIPKKRQFVTIKEINQEKERRLNKSRKEKQISSTSVIPTKKAGEDLKSTEREDAISTEREGGLMGLDEYMKRFEILPVHEDLVEGAGEVHEGEVNEYEMRRIRNIEENEKIFEELGLKRRTRNSVQLLNEDKPNNVLSDEDGSEYMCPENDQEQQSDHEEDIVASKAKKKAKKVVVQTDGPRTRSRASKMPKPCDKEVKRVEVQTDHQGNDESNNVPTVEKLKLLKSSAPGSMEKYLELREQEKQAAILQSQSQPENQESQPESDAPTEVEKRKRGKSKLGHVHTRGEKKEIKLSDLGQPISDDDDHLLSEFSNFLGTTVREFVSLTCRSWSEVLKKTSYGSM
ncbi:uncharacterized protein LOC135150128 [Daucus carota subsp. sativus]|uniref:uncharacterized protein LOC135150128 n=1 Tax=Daucus carota subsp. sativus TaxID=79200 RepID=UPI0030831685